MSNRSHIENNILNCSIYLYGCEDDARTGAKAGYSGFIAGVPSTKQPEHIYLYAVTNSRVIKNDRHVIRIDTFGERLIVLDAPREEWRSHPGGADLAIYPLKLTASQQQMISYYPVSQFLTEEMFSASHISPGDDVFLVSRFINHRGEQRSSPNLLFGRLSMTGKGFFRQRSGSLSECFIADVKGSGSDSGSPVFIDSVRIGTDYLQALASGTTRKLLGISLGHLPSRPPVVDAQDNPHPRGWKIKLDTGLTIILPAWQICDLLNSEVLLNLRRKQDEQLRRELIREESISNEEREFTREDFLDALRQVSRKISDAQLNVHVTKPILVKGKRGVSYTEWDFLHDFPDDETCLEWLKNKLHPEGIHCCKCECITLHHKIKSRPSYSCDYCGHNVHPTTGTIFYKSRTSLHTWFKAIYLVASSGGSIRVKEINKRLGVEYKTTLRMSGLIQKMLFVA
jgi:transposase-like protein